MALYNYKIPVIILKQKKTSHSVLVNHGKTLQIFSRTDKHNSRTFNDFPGSQKNPRLFQDVATLVSHEVRQAFSVLISVATQREALVLRIVYGCP